MNMSVEKAHEIINGFQSSNPQIRKKSVKELKCLCEIIGEKKTSNELIEFLHHMKEEDCDVLLELSNELIYLVNFIKNINECKVLFYFILSFVFNYDNKINIHGYNALKIYIDKCDENILLNFVFRKIMNYSKSDSDNYKIGISKIIPFIIKKCIFYKSIKHIKILIYLFMNLCKDPCILVRKSCCDKFCEFLNALKLYKDNLYNFDFFTYYKEKYKNDMKCKDNLYEHNLQENEHILQEKEHISQGNEHNLYKEKKLFSDTYDIKKDTDIDQMIKEISENTYFNSTINKMYYNIIDEDNEKLYIEKIWQSSKEIYTSFLYPYNGLNEVQISSINILNDILNIDINFVKEIETILSEISNDENWRVRAVLANNIHKILKKINNDKLSAIVLLLLKDIDSNVRSIILDNLDQIFLNSSINTNIIKEIFEDLKRDIDSNNYHLKISLCKLLCVLPDFLDKNNSIDYILPLFLLFVRVEETELKSELFTCLHKITKLISFSDMKRIIIALTNEIIKNKNWRLRFSLYYYFKFFDHFFFIKTKDSLTFNNKDFWNIFQTGSKDTVYAIRMVVIETIKFLMQSKSFHYFEKGLIFFLNNLKESKNYLQRITCLMYISKLIHLLPLDFIKTNILNILNCLTKDKIKNVKFNVIKTLYHIITYINFILQIIEENKYNEFILDIKQFLQKQKNNSENNSSNLKNNIDKNNQIKKDHSQYFDELENDKQLFQINHFNYLNNINNNDKKKLNNTKNTFEYLNILENKYNLSNIKNINFFTNITSCSLCYYDNMKNTDDNKTNCQYILKYVSDILNYLSVDSDYEITKASNYLKNNNFYFYLTMTDYFNITCKPIK